MNSFAEASLKRLVNLLNVVGRSATRDRIELRDWTPRLGVLRSLLIAGCLSAVALPPTAPVTHAAPGGQAVGTVGIGIQGTDAVVDPTTGIMWVTGSNGEVVAVNTTSLGVEQRLQLDTDEYYFPVGAVIDVPGRSLWTGGSDRLTKIDLVTAQTAQQFRITHPFPSALVHMFSFAISPDGRYAYVGFSEGIIKVDTASGQTLEAKRWVSPDQAGLAKFVISPDGNTLYAVRWDCRYSDAEQRCVQDTNLVTAHDTSTLAEKGRVRLNPSVAGISWYLAVTPDGQTLFVDAPVNGGGEEILAIDTTTMTVTDVAVPSTPERVNTEKFEVRNMAVSPSGSQLWYGRPGGLGSKNLVTGQINDPSPTEGGFDCLTFSPSGDKVFTCGFGQSTVSALVVFGAPGAPEDLSVKTDPKGLEVTWSPPTETGGLPEITYTAVASPGGAKCQTRKLSCRIPGLRAGVAYDVSVTAANTYGESTAARISETGKRIAIARPPKKVAAALRGQDVKVTWKAPRATEGQEIAGYMVTASPSGKTCRVKKAIGCTFEDLSVGLRYRFSVQAVTSTGSGEAALSKTVLVPVPTAPPLPPVKPIRVFS